MRISYWSSDVCSSDVYYGGAEGDEDVEGPVINVVICEGVVLPVPLLSLSTNKVHTLRAYVIDRILEQPTLPATRRFVSQQIGRASCRERAGQSEYISVVAVSLKKNNNIKQYVA